jgi:hypothetical protein
MLVVSGILFGYLDTGKAETIPIPSVPQFTVRFVDNSYTVPPVNTTSTDGYTGKQVVTTTQGYYIQDKYLEVTIQNQPFTIFTDLDSGKKVALYYDVRWRGHFTEGNYWFDTNSSGVYLISSSCVYADGVLMEPNAPTTSITIGFYGNNGTSHKSFRISDVPDGGQVDFQVQAFIGYYTQEPIVYQYPRFMDQPTDYNIFHGQSSGWSSTQTLAITSASASVSPSPTVPEYPFTVILLLLGVFLVVAIALVRKKCKTIECKTVS